jgi:YidC/Oxa1 family membrane protein insertase
MTQQQPTGFFDKNTVIAILLSFAVFFGWQQYMQKKYPKAYEPKQEEVLQTEGKTPIENKAQKIDEAKTVQEAIDSGKDLPVLPKDSQSQELNSKQMNFKVAPTGMAIYDLSLNEYKRRNGDPIIYMDPIQFLQIDGSKDFNLEKTSENTFLGQMISSEKKVSVEYKVEPDNYLVKIKISVQQTEKSLVTVEARSVYDVLPVPSSFLLPPTDFQEFFASSAGEIHREKVQPDAVFKQEYQQANIAAFNSQYFAQAFLNRSEIFPTFSAAVDNKKALLVWKYNSVQPTDSYEVKYEVYLGPKKEDILKKVDDSLVDMIDYGVFSFIGRPMHTALLYIHRVVGNWGLAIILITLILRTLILPAGVYSYRSMKKMQKIQPKLQAIKEKHKGDPQRANQETLQLMRTEKANPLSGCIPALLQLPIFIAFFTMMSSSFELYMQPFYFWIHDLSSKDPFYVFPLLAGAAMFVQMKMTPTTTTDPAQAKIMSMMPILFSVFMLSTPSGLALYMFVGSLFSIFQQVIFMKEKTT